MSVLDILIALVFASCALYGVIRGFVRLAIGLAGLVASLALALRLAESGPRWFEGIFQAESASRFAAFLVVLVAGLIATALLSWLAFRLVRAAQVGWMDRLAGGLVGVGGALVVVCALLVGLTTFMPPGSTLLSSSRLLPYVIGAADVAATILPPRMAEEYRVRREQLDDAQPQA